MENNLVSHCEPLYLLTHLESTNACDRHEGRCIENLYLLMKKDTFFRNVTETIINARNLYTRYFALDSKGDLTEHYRRISNIESDLVFIASTYIACHIWNSHCPGISESFWRVIGAHPNLNNLYTKNDVHVSMQRIVTVLNGRITQPAFIKTKGDKGSLFHTLTMWFIRYRRFAFVEPRHAYIALTIVSYDTEHMDRNTSKTQPGTMHNDEKVRLVCQLVVRCLGEILRTQYIDRVHTKEAYVLSCVTKLDYTSEIKSESGSRGESSSDDEEEEEEERSFCTTNDGSHLQMTSILCDNREDNGTLVFRATWNPGEKANPKHYTIKRYTTEDWSETLFTCVREVAALCLLRGYRDFIGIPRGIDFSERPGVCDLYMDPHGVCLIDFLRSNRAFFNSTALGSLFHNMATAIALCHHHNIVHNDVKPENFIVHDGRAKLIDFGLAMCHFSFLYNVTDNVQSLSYRAPELLMGDNAYTSATDVWALACTVYWMCTDSMLFAAKKADCVSFDRYGAPILVRARQLKIMQYRCDSLGDDTYLRSCPHWSEYIQTRANLHHRYRPCSWSRVPPEIETLLRECLKFTPTERPSARHLVRRLRHSASLF